MPRITSVQQRQLTVAAPDQTLDRVLSRLVFDPGTGFNSTVQAIAVQSDGGILMGGLFASYDEVTQNRITRLNADGTRDTGFSIGTGFSSTVFAIALQPDSKILVGGSFTSYDGTTQNRITRLNADGTRDTGFSIGTGFSSTVYAIAVQSDGGILLGGFFTSYDGTTQNYITRLNADGTRDTDFSIGTGFNGIVNAIALQPDGRILVGGQFTSYDGTTQNRITRLNADGTRDTDFSTGTGFNNSVGTIEVQSDGKILVGGGFTTYDGVTVNYITRLNADGTLDIGFTTAMNNVVRAIKVQSNGKILVGGDFTSPPGNRITRLNADGSRDTGFSTGNGFDNFVSAITEHPDGKILVGGSFTSYNSEIQNRIAALNRLGGLLATSLPVVSYTLTVGTEVTEGSPLELTLSTINVRDGSQLRWQILDSPEEFAAGSGSTSVSSDQAEIIVFPLDDGIFEPQRETFRVRVSKPLGTELALTSDIDILDNSLFIFEGTATPPSQFLLESGHKTVITTSYIIAGPERDNFDTRQTIVVWSRQTLDITQIITNPNPLKHGTFEVNPDYFGNSFDANDQYLVIGSPRDGLTGDLNGSGLAYVYGINNGQWELTQTLRNPNNIGTTQDDLFGYEISLQGSIALISAPREDDSTTTNEGKIYVYDLDLGSEDPKIVLDNPSTGVSEEDERFGERIAQSLSYAAISSLKADRSGEGTEDTDFSTNIGSGFNAAVLAIAVQSDGGILVGGNFTTFNGATRNRLVRLNSDGSHDAAFYTNLGTGFGASVSAIALQSDGKILAGGSFTTFNGNTRNRIVRLNANGTEDTAFSTNIGTGFNSIVYAIALQSDGKILVGGSFTQYNGTTRNRLVRLNANGTEDTAFYTNLGTGFSSYINDIALQSDGKILFGGNFGSFNGNTRNRIVRLNSDGTEDTDFSTNIGTGFSGGDVNAIALQSDGKIIVGGSFINFNSTSSRNLSRLNADGTLDTLFFETVGAPFIGASGNILCISVQSDDKILIGGSFSIWKTKIRNDLIRLNSDGTEDLTFIFNTGTQFGDGDVISIAVQSDGKVLVGGFFTLFNGNTRNRLIRLESNDIVYTDSGKVDIYDRADWSLITTLINPEPITDGATVTNDRFGYSIDITDNYTVVATEFESTGSNVPKIYVYRNTDWQHIYTVSLDDLRNKFRVRLQGDYLFVVAVNRTSPISTRILVFDLKRGRLYAEISEPPGVEFQVLEEITVKDDLVAIGDPGYDDSTVNANTGQIYLFRSQENINSYTGSIFGILNGDFQLGAGIRALSLQEDGKIVAGGEFRFFNSRLRNYLTRLNTDGTEDTVFYTNLGSGFDSTIVDIALQSDGKILVGGFFTSYDGTTRNRLVRLNSDGTEDTDFYTNLGTGFDSAVNGIALQSDGKILVVGQFTTFNGNTRNRIVRLNSDGTEDTAFSTNIGTGFNSTTNKVVALSGDKILVGGVFTSYDGTTQNRITRLNADGTRDTGFTIGTGFNGTVATITQQSDSKILVGGFFTSYDGTSQNCITRLNADGTRDTGFTIGTGFNQTVATIAQQSDSKILVGGFFTSYDGTSQNRITRLNADGTLDTDFAANIGTGFNDGVRAIALQSDGRILVGGVSTNFNGIQPGRLVRLNEDGTSNSTSSTVILTTAAIPDFAPINLSAPALFGSSQAVVGQVVRTTRGTWAGTQPLSYTYQWQRGTVDISGATSSSYTVTIADIGSTLRCVVTATNIIDAVSATSQSTATVAPTYSVSPAADNVDEGSSLSFTVTTTGVANDTTLYWTVTNAGDFATATGSFTITDNSGTFSVTPSEDETIEGAETFQAQVRTGSTSGDIVATSDPITINDTSVGVAPSNTDLPTISGTAEVGQTLTCSTGTWTGTPDPSYTFQWQRVSTNISGATNSTYTVTNSDIGSTLRCVVTATNAAGSESATSGSTDTVPTLSESSYTTAGTYTWIAPPGVTSVSVVAVGGGGGAGNGDSLGGGGAGGNLRYVNNISVSPGSSYTVVVGAGGTRGGSTGDRLGTPGGLSSFNGSTVVAQGGGGGGSTGGQPTTSGNVGTGGNGGSSAGSVDGGGGGAGGYSGNGGTGGNGFNQTQPTAGSGGGGGGGGSGSGAGGGGGVGIFGSGSNGAAGTGQAIYVSGIRAGGGGSSGLGGGSSTTTGETGIYGGTYQNGGLYGGGGGGGYGGGNGGGGAVRIIWPGNTRQFPSTQTGQQ